MNSIGKSILTDFMPVGNIKWEIYRLYLTICDHHFAITDYLVHARLLTVLFHVEIVRVSSTTSVVEALALEIESIVVETVH